MASESAQYLSSLHKQIDQYFSFNEIKTICFDLGVDYENIPGNIRSAFTRNLIVSLAKQNRLQELISIVRTERPFLDWQDIPADFELPTTIAQEDIRQVVNYNTYYGDNISVGDISGGENFAIGSKASARMEKTTTHSSAVSTNRVLSPSTNTDIQQSVVRLQQYIALVPEENKATSDELVTSINLIQEAANQPVTALHLKLLCLGLLQLSRELMDSIPEQVLVNFITAVQQSNT